MEITRTAKPVKKMADLNVWHCPGCGVVHMTVGETLLNFSQDEFARFADSVVNIQYSGWTAACDEFSIADLAAAQNDTIH